jgi:uncharacterized membrane protein YeaQ/YmgE (transglycosylase-associated protein family)
MSTQLIVTIIIGIVAGFLAGRVMKGRGFGLFGDLIIGLLGGLLGYFLVENIWPGVLKFGPYIIKGAIAFVGACILIWLLRLIKK